MYVLVSLFSMEGRYTIALFMQWLNWTGFFCLLCAMNRRFCHDSDKYENVFCLSYNPGTCNRQSLYGGAAVATHAENPFKITWFMTTVEFLSAHALITIDVHIRRSYHSSHVSNMTPNGNLILVQLYIDEKSISGFEGSVAPTQMSSMLDF